MKYKIYKLVHNELVVYVGITTKTLEQRKRDRYRGMSVEHIADKCNIELIEETDDKTRERYWIEYYASTVVNKRKAAGFNKLEYSREYNKKYKSINKEKVKEYTDAYNKEYYQLNKERIKEQTLKYYHNNK
jgi:hypothetical protein